MKKFCFEEIRTEKYWYEIEAENEVEAREKYIDSSPEEAKGHKNIDIESELVKIEDLEEEIKT